MGWTWLIFQNSSPILFKMKEKVFTVQKIKDKNILNQTGRDKEHIKNNNSTKIVFIIIFAIQLSLESWNSMQTSRELWLRWPCVSTRTCLQN